MSDNKLQAKGYVVWSICALFFLYEFLLRVVIGTYQPSIMRDLGLNPVQFSLVSTTLFLLIYGSMQVPAGLIIDNIGLKKSLMLGSVFCALASLGFSYADSYYAALIYRMCMGFGASFGFLCLLVSVHDWMPHKYSAIFIGISQFIGTLGPMIATGPLDTLNVSWRFVFLSLSGLGFVLLILVFFFVENNREKADKYVILYKPEKISTSLLRLFSRAQPWYIALLSTSLYFAVEYLSENEGRAFLGLKGIAPDGAGYMLTLSWIGYAVGCPLWGFLSDFLERRKSVLKYSSVLGVIAIVMVLYSSSKLHLQIAFFLLGTSAAGQTVGFALMAEQFKKQFVAVGFGLNNGMITGVSAINAPIIGLLLDHVSKGKTPALPDYLYAFNVLVAIALLAVVISTFFIKETYCKSAVELTVLQKTR